MIKNDLNINITASIKGKVVFFLHAFPVNQKMWQPQFEFLDNRNIAYLSFDYPGFGNSSLISNKMNMLDYGVQAKKILNSLGCKRAIFVGLSMGGYVALNLYRNFPDIFAGLLLANTRAGADSEVVKKNRLKTIRNLKENSDLTTIIDFHISKFFTDKVISDNPNLIQVLESMIKETSVLGIIQALEAMANRPGSEDLLPQIEIPVKIIMGEQDTLIPAAEAEQLRKFIPNASLHRIPNAAHLSNMEQPNQFNRILWELLKTCE